jgi:hypothetical protein
LAFPFELSRHLYTLHTVDIQRIDVRVPSAFCLQCQIPADAASGREPVDHVVPEAAAAAAKVRRLGGEGRRWPV